MKKRNIMLLFLIIISYLGLTSCMYIDPNITTTIISNIYRGTLSSSGTLSTYYIKDKGDVPYVDIVDVTESVLGREKTSFNKVDEGFKVTRTDNESYMIVNCENDTIYFSNYDLFVLKKDNDAFNPKSPTYKFSKTIKSEELVKNEVTFDLKKYDIDLFESKGIAYVPFQIYDTLIYSALDISLSFNGHDYFYVSDANKFLNKSYYDKYFSGRKQSGERSKFMAEFTYNHLLFALDNFFGIKDARKIESISDLCVENDLKDDLLSTSSLKFNEALADLIYTYLDDGHSSFVISSNYLIYDNVADAKYSDTYKGVRRTALSNARDNLSAKRNAKRGLSLIGQGLNETYNASGNTLVVTIDSFEFPSTDYYEIAPNSSNYSNDSFGILYHAFNYYIPRYERTYRTKINNVVIDVTLNGGGYVDDCLGLIGFLTNEYSVLYENSASKNISKTTYTVDTNLDGNFDELDSYEGKYNFYILTSNYSFSCSNMLASVAKEQNIAKVIGEETGGGGAIVQNLCLADSTSINISGPHSLVYLEDDKVHYAEDKITPDYKLSSSYFYTPRIIDEFIKTISN